MWLKTSWTFKGRSFFLSFTKIGERRTNRKHKGNWWRNCWLLSLQRKNVCRDTRMISNKKSSFPRAASRLVLYTNLKKTNRQRRRREKRNREEVDSGGGGSERVVFLGLTWLTQLGRCDVLPWVRGGGQWVMVRVRDISGISVCTYVCFCMWSVPPVIKSPACLITESADHPAPPNFHLSLPPYWQVFTPRHLIGTCMNWANLRRLWLLSVLSSVDHPLVARGGFYSFNLFVWSFLCEDNADNWDFSDSLRA